MKILDLETLAAVSGGASKSSQLTQSLSSIQSSISDLASNKNNNQSSNLLLPILLLGMNRQQRSPSVVSAGGATVVQG